MEFSSVRHCFVQAIHAFQSADRKLFELGAGERALTGRILHHLINRFPDHDVDMEYNRRGIGPKRLGSDSRGGSIYPDLVIHRRGANDCNLLGVEIKRLPAKASDLDRDRTKLKGLREEYCYQHTLLLMIRPRLAVEGAEFLYEWDGHRDGSAG